MPFALPAGVEIGAATSSWQIEGAATTRGRCIWDDFAQRPGAIVDATRAEPACDHVHRLAEDLDLMAWLGLDAYRFSISWPRVILEGTGPVSTAGLDFYDRLVDGLLQRGIAPLATLYHWDLPSPLQAHGGWASRDTSARFADYAGVVAQRLGDRVHRWATINEPWCAAFLGYGSGVHAPGRTDPGDSLRAAYHLLLAHGLGTQVLRSTVAAGVPLSLVLNLGDVRPAGPGAADQDAARRVDGLVNRIFLDPVFRGSLPDDVLTDTGHLVDWPTLVRAGDAAVIASPLDVLGVNYYQPAVVAAGTAPAGPDPWPGCEGVVHLRAPGEVTDMDWPIDPTGLRNILLRVRADYGDIPLMVTENGAAYADEVVDGAVHDQARIDYLRGHLAATHEAIQAGADVRGYFVWSLLDNFEWSFGYAKRFGIVHVDYATQARTLKDSALWYGEVIAAGGL